MNFLEKLKSIINFESPKKIENVRFLSFDNKNKKYEYHDNRVLNININSSDEKMLLMIKELLKSFKEEGGILLEDRTKQIFEDVSSVSKDKENERLLDFFKGILPVQDIEILRASLIIRSLYNKKQNISYLKEGLIMRYGERGNNISNLCTAGYFETIIKPLYDHMYSETDFYLNKFLNRYEVIVTQYPFAVFVGKSMSYEELTKEVFNKMIAGKKYGSTFVNIHGIGTRNIELINKLIEENKKKFNLPLEIDSGPIYIKVKIIL